MHQSDKLEPAQLVDTAGVGGPRSAGRHYSLKHGDTYMVVDAVGDITGNADGLFCNDTRHLSCWRLTIGGLPPTLLSSAIAQDNVLFSAHLTNRPLPVIGGQGTPEGVIHLHRTQFLWRDTLYESLCLSNYGAHHVVLPIEFQFASDFVDMFEVRGLSRAHRGRIHAPVLHDRSVVTAYDGLDGATRHTNIHFSETPSRLSATRAEYQFTLPSRGRHEVFIRLGANGAETPDRTRFRTAAAAAHRDTRTRRRNGANLNTSSRLFNEWIDKSRADVTLLTTDLSAGPFPYAGIPWFSTPFGRDSIITALQMLWLDPSLARGVLRFLAANQAHETSDFRAAAPGKIMHETRKGEMALLNEVPYRQYYGGVDTTPLYIMLAAAYAGRTNDQALIDEIWPALLSATSWLEDYGDTNGDGLIDYPNNSPTGLTNQAWKDSSDSIFHAGGRMPLGPIAVIEVQAYACAAFRSMAELARTRGDAAKAARWQSTAIRLTRDIDERFWMKEHAFYGIAIDGHGELCRVRASNAGHVLFTGVAREDRARSVIETLLSPPFNSGWGIRTLANTERRFNPMSYHNGSVWPHDTALCAAGMGRYGEREGPVQILNSLFEAATRFDMRMPELYCGFPRARGESPVAYPVACLPQAWSASAVFLLLQTCLGITIDGARGTIDVDRPHLPAGVDQLTVSNLSVGAAKVDLKFKRVSATEVAHTIA